MNEEAWMKAQTAELRKEAFEECALCRGRENGDCCEHCRFFQVTATDSEKEAVLRADAKFRRSTRGWNGAFVPSDS